MAPPDPKNKNNAGGPPPVEAEAVPVQGVAGGLDASLVALIAATVAQSMAAVLPKLLSVGSQDAATNALVQEGQLMAANPEMMRKQYVVAGYFNNLAVGGMRAVRLPTGRVIEIPMTIADVEKRFRFAWLSPADMAEPQFEGFFAVTPELLPNVPKSKFVNNVITRGGLTYCACAAEWDDDRQAQELDHLNRRLATFAKDDAKPMKHQATGPKPYATLRQDAMIVHGAGEADSDSNPLDGRPSAS